MPSAALIDSLQWYRRHQMLAGALFWLPTSFLFLVEQNGLGTALRVQAVYYAAVVVLEVPSGWFSDRLGRTLTLRLVAVWWLIAHLLFVVSPATVGLAGLLMAQIFLAAGYAFLSGTDVMLHFDTLEALGRAEEFDRREASTRRGLLTVTAATALVGGAAGLVDLRLPFALSLVAAAIQLTMAWQLVEPSRPTPGEPTETPFGRPSLGRGTGAGHDLKAVIRHLSERPLSWLGLYVIAQVVAVHLAADLTGPYLAEALGIGLAQPGRAALATGTTAAAVALIGAVTVPIVPTVGRKLGLATTLLGVAIIPTGLLVAMASATTIWLVPLLAFRGIQGAASAVLVPAVVGGHVEQERRATFLSATSLGGRLAYGAVLVLIASTGGVGLGRGLSVAAMIAIVLTAAVLASYRPLARGRIGLDHDHEHEHPAKVHDHPHVHLDESAIGTDDHHNHGHDPQFVGAHHHRHDHSAMRHRHRHTADDHHRHTHSQG